MKDYFHFLTFTQRISICSLFYFISLIRFLFMFTCKSPLSFISTLNNRNESVPTDVPEPKPSMIFPESETFTIYL